MGEDWFDYLLCEPCTPFRIRIRKNTLLDDGQQQLRADVCFQYLQVGQSKVLSNPQKSLEPLALYCRYATGGWRFVNCRDRS